MSDDTPEQRARPRVAKGNRPWFLDDPDTERVLSIALAIASEVSVLHDRIDTLERVAADQPTFSLADLDTYEPDEGVEGERAAWRKAFLGRMFRILREEIDGLDAAERTASYESFVSSLGEDEP